MMYYRKPILKQKGMFDKVKGIWRKSDVLVAKEFGLKTHETAPDGHNIPLVGTRKGQEILIKVEQRADGVVYCTWANATKYKQAMCDPANYGNKIC